MSSSLDLKSLEQAFEGRNDLILAIKSAAGTQTPLPHYLHLWKVWARLNVVHSVAGIRRIV